MSDLSSDTPCFHARAVFIDFEDTLIIKRPNSVGKHSIHDSMVELLVSAKKVDRQEAARMVQETSADLHRPMEEVCQNLGIDLAALRKEIMRWLPAILTTDPEAQKTLDHFRKIGLKMWPATTNSGFLCSLKLEAVGLGDTSGNPYFEELMGGSEVHPLGKSTAGFFKNLLQRSGFGPTEVVHIGDQRAWDRDASFRAGIRQVILLDPTLSEPCLEGKDGVIYVSNWGAIRGCVKPL